MAKLEELKEGMSLTRVNPVTTYAHKITVGKSYPIIWMRRNNHGTPVLAVIDDDIGRMHRIGPIGIAHWSITNTLNKDEQYLDGLISKGERIH